MPRLEGLGHMHAGDLASTFGLGANGLAEPDTHIGGTVAVRDDENAHIEMADGESFAIEILDEAGAIIDVSDESIAIEMRDDADTEIEIASDKV